MAIAELKQSIPGSVNNTPNLHIAPEPKTTQETNAAPQTTDRETLQTHHLAPNGNGKHTKTIAEAEQESSKTLTSLLADVRRGCNLLAAGFCLTAAVMVKVLPEKNPARKFVEDWAAHFARLAIGMIGGATGAVDAIRSGKPLLAGAQIGDAITSVIAPLKEMTNYRGLWVGAYNALPSLETIHGKGSYKGVGDYVRTNWEALKSTLSRIVSNPWGLFDPRQKGELGVVSGLAISICSALYIATGIKAFASLRDVFGITVEGEKAKPQHLKEGRGRYAMSGYLMMAGSAANIQSKYSPKNSLVWSYINLAFNAIGKMFYLDSLQAQEPASIGKPLTFQKMLHNSFKNLFSFGKQTREVLEEIQPTLLKIEDQPEALRQQVKVIQEGRQAERWSSGGGSRVRTYSSGRSGGSSGGGASGSSGAPTNNGSSGAAPVNSGGRAGNTLGNGRGSGGTDTGKQIQLPASVTRTPGTGASSTPKPQSPKPKAYVSTVSKTNSPRPVAKKDD